MGRRGRLGPGCLDDRVQDQMAGSSRAGECRQNCRGHPPSRLVELADRRSRASPQPPIAEMHRAPATSTRPPTDIETILYNLPSDMISSCLGSPLRTR